MSYRIEDRPLTLITRPIEDASFLVSALDRLGYESLVEPMLSIEPSSIATEVIDEGVAACQAMLVTSANGVRAFAARSDRRDFDVFAVGDASAAKARELGFQRVKSAAGNVETLVQLLRNERDEGILTPSNGALYHPAGSDVAGDLKAGVEALGFQLVRQVLYHAKKVTSLSSDCRAALHDGRISVATFFSPRTARCFVEIVENEEYSDLCAVIDAYALSKPVADALSALPWRTVYACGKPTQEEMLGLIERRPA